MFGEDAFTAIGVFFKRTVPHVQNWCKRYYRCNELVEGANRNEILLVKTEQAELTTQSALCGAEIYQHMTYSTNQEPFISKYRKKIDRKGVS